MKLKGWTQEELDNMKIKDCPMCKNKPRWFHSLSGDYRIYCNHCYDAHLLVMTHGYKNPADAAYIWNNAIK